MKYTLNDIEKHRNVANDHYMSNTKSDSLELLMSRHCYCYAMTLNESSLLWLVLPVW